jgi:hypothetical protein
MQYEQVRCGKTIYICYAMGVLRMSEIYIDL